MYLVAFIAAIVVARLRLRMPHVAAQGWTVKDIDDMLFYGVLGTILGGRLGYVLFYKASFYFAHPAGHLQGVGRAACRFTAVFLGVTLAMVLFAWQRGRTWLEVTDFVAPMVPTGLAAAGSATSSTASYGAVSPIRRRPGRCCFPQPPMRTPDGSRRIRNRRRNGIYGEVYAQYHMLPRHPSELYEIALEAWCYFLCCGSSRANRVRSGGRNGGLV